MGHDLTILIAEDNPNEALLLERALMKAGINHPPQMVHSGEEAIEYLQGSGRFSNRQDYPFPNLLFTDLKMPFKSGFDVLRWLQTHHEKSALPVIVLTSSCLEADVMEAYQLGANSYIVKPGSFNDLVDMVRLTYDYWRLCEKPVVPENC